MKTRILFSSIFFLITIGIFIPLYSTIGTIGYMISFGIATTVATLTYILIGSLLQGTVNWKNSMDIQWKTMKDDTVAVLHKFDQEMSEKYDAASKDLKNYYEKMAKTFQDSVDEMKTSNTSNKELIVMGIDEMKLAIGNNKEILMDSVNEMKTFNTHIKEILLDSITDMKATNARVKSEILENSKKQQEVSESFMKQTMEVTTSFKEEVHHAREYFKQAQSMLDNMTTSMLEIANETKEQATNVTEDLNSFTNRMILLFETRLEEEFKTLVSTKEHIHTVLLEMKTLQADSEDRQQDYFENVENKYENLFDAFYQNQQTFNQTIADNGKQQKNDLVEILQQTKASLLDVLHTQKESTDDVSGEFLNIQQKLMDSNEQLISHISEQAKIGEKAKSFYTDNQNALNNMLSSMVSISSRSEEQMSAVTNDLQLFTSTITELFENRLNEEYQILQHTKEDIHENLKTITHYVTTNDEQVKDYLAKIGSSYQDGFHLFLENQKKFNRSFDGHMEKLKEVIEILAEDTSDELKELLSGQKKQTTDFIAELLELQKEMATAQEVIQKQMGNLMAEYDKNVQLTRNIQEEMMKLNKQDVELISQLMGVR